MGTEKFSPANKRRNLNLVLSNGLFVISVKRRNNSPLLQFYLTDYNLHTRLIVDMDSKQIISNPHKINLSEKDIDLIVSCI